MFVQIVSLRDADSDEEMEEAPHQSTGAAPEQAEHAQGVQLPAWKPLEPELAPKKRKRQKKEEIVCSVCGDADEAEGYASPALPNTSDSFTYKRSHQVVQDPSLP